MSDGNTNIVWLDLETTGLDPAADGILECAVVITNAALDEIACLELVTGEARRFHFDKLHPAVQRMHGTGLWCESLVSERTIAQLDAQVVAFVHEFGGDRACLGGNSVHFDAEFMRRDMPLTLAALHYRQINVSSLNELAWRWWPEVYTTRPMGATHRALADVRNSIAQARHYQNAISTALLRARLAVEP